MDVFQNTHMLFIYRNKIPLSTPTLPFLANLLKNKQVRSRIISPGQWDNKSLICNLWASQRCHWGKKCLKNSNMQLPFDCFPWWDISKAGSWQQMRPAGHQSLAILSSAESCPIKIISAHCDLLEHHCWPLRLLQSCLQITNYFGSWESQARNKNVPLKSL